MDVSCCSCTRTTDRRMTKPASNIRRRMLDARKNLAKPDLHARTSARGSEPARVPLQPRFEHDFDERRVADYSWANQESTLVEFKWHMPIINHCLLLTLCVDSGRGSQVQKLILQYCSQPSMQLNSLWEKAGGNQMEIQQILILAGVSRVNNKVCQFCFQESFCLITCQTFLLEANFSAYIASCESLRPLETHVKKVGENSLV